MTEQVAIRLLGGVDEVGGNSVLLEDFTYDVKLFLDFGIKIGNFYECYERGQHPSCIEELVDLNLIPNEDSIPINNLYTREFENAKVRAKAIKNAQTPAEKHMIDQNYPSNLDAILISHSHKDHYFGLSFVNRTIPLCTGEVTKKIIMASCKSAKFSLDKNFEGLNWHTFRTGDILYFKEMRIVPFHVDHSIPAAYGFIVYSSAGPIVYTGDFRMHGPLSHMTRDFLNEIKTNKVCLSISDLTQDQKSLISEGVKVLICEGTHIQKGMVESEENVESDLTRIFESNPFDFILVKYDRVDWDRFRTFSHIANKYGWKYIITEKDAYFYYLLNKGAIHETMMDPNILEDDHIYILKRGAIIYKWQEKIRQIIYKRGKADRFLEYRDLKSLEGKFLIYITHLHNTLMNNLDFARRGLFISSSIDPYSEEFFDNTQTIRRELEPYGIPAYRVHASGHATPHDIINLIEEVKPKFLIPIHTEHPKFFRTLFQGTDIQVILPIKNKAFEI